MKRYVVTVKENNDRFHSFNIKEVNKWINLYSYECEKQDDPWEPHFKITTETIE